MKNLQQLRSAVRKIIAENAKDKEEMKKTAANVAVKSVKKALDMHIDQEIFTIKGVKADNQDVDYNGVRLVMILGHADVPVKEMQQKMAAKGGKYAKIYDDAPTSKTQAVRQLTNDRRANVTPDDQASSLKMLQMIGYEALEDVCDEIEKSLDCEAIANLFDVVKKGKGESHWELFLNFPEGGGPSSIQWETSSYISVKGGSYYHILPGIEDELDIKDLNEIEQKKHECHFSVGNLSVDIKPHTDYTDPRGGRNHKFYFCGYLVSWDDRPPAGFATGSSRYYFYGPNQGEYILSYHSRDDNERHDYYYDFNEAKKGAEQLIKDWMARNDVKFGEGVTPQYQKQLDSLYNHDWAHDGMV